MNNGTQPKLNAVCSFVAQSCSTDADFVILSNCCLISTRLKAVFFLDYLYLLFQFFRMVILQEKHIIHRIRQLLPLQKRRKLFLESLWKISGICGWKNNDNNTTVNQALCVRDNCLCFVWDSKGQRTYSVPFLLEAECAHQKYNCVKRL